MPESLEILKMRALICFLNEDPALCTVTGLADIPASYTHLTLPTSVHV